MAITTPKRRHRRPGSVGLYVDLSRSQYRAVKHKAALTKQPLKRIVENLLDTWLSGTVPPTCTRPLQCGLTVHVGACALARP